MSPQEPAAAGLQVLHRNLHMITDTEASYLKLESYLFPGLIILDAEYSAGSPSLSIVP
ncbi:hypothetical protein COCC4DRAFT_31999 [Bipolaris maydis ATCC 48331]|uniref:Uncharacterized protein n=2 Tax=Cochliobolus heterostrophus TaxID=5016 RepID=M2TQJ4_COCH5|nr:uncharacterized protein COCC4DRAFT_31999 [Bipolaris maydis ATCC 48331]EMD88799.1 hypothetical protein COCHEDRAFT_1023028 [Bipolaris maydis C5]ENI05485.1 hypothetical protein COCC4DRAFT_31999 [Bipolaris maydis ATCC 48331]